MNFIMVNLNDEKTEALPAAAFNGGLHRHGHHDDRRAQAGALD